MAKLDNMMDIVWKCVCGWSCRGINVNELEPQASMHRCEENEYTGKLPEKDKTA
jgi:hypothetical protein